MKFKKQIESDRVDTFFASLLDRFHKALFGLDHDHPDTPKADFFIIFNKAWLNFCERHNEKAKHYKANKEAFYDYAIKKD